MHPATQKQTVLVTGGAGFVGSHLCGRLVAEGHTVISLDNYFAGSRDNHVLGVEYREGHTKDVEKLVPESIDLIYHLGEYSRVEISLTEPSLVFDLNTIGTLGVLEFWRARKCKLVYAGSSTKFGDGGLSRTATPYAWTKAANTELVKNYGEWYGLPFAVTYFYNVYGPRERSGAYGTLIEIFRQKHLKGEVLGVVTPGTQRRNFTYVGDIVAGLVLVGEKGEGDNYGLGDTKQYSILEIAKMFGDTITMLPERAGNRESSAIDISKAQALGWNPTKGVAEYIHEVTEMK
ncbi:NAD-dependent epimerase/dehydratase family protein [Patescibacteria group bacterium]|nr:MAG: NAD-dependent epimerase/dehydratase family protein [Patescibacteria group bacterium]